MSPREAETCIPRLPATRSPGGIRCTVRQGVTAGMTVGVNTEVVAGEGLIVTAGGMDAHVHFICPQLYEEVGLRRGSPACVLARWVGLGRLARGRDPREIVGPRRGEDGVRARAPGVLACLVRRRRRLEHAQTQENGFLYIYSVFRIGFGGCLVLSSPRKVEPADGAGLPLGPWSFPARDDWSWARAIGTSPRLGRLVLPGGSARVSILRVETLVRDLRKGLAVGIGVLPLVYATSHHPPRFVFRYGISSPGRRV